MQETIERVIFLFILVITTYYNITLGFLVCFIVIVIYFQHTNHLTYEGFTVDDDDCNIVKIPVVNVITNTPYTAIMVEPRNHKALDFVMRNFTDNLSNEWNFIIYHGTENEKTMKNIVSSLSSDVQNRITLVNLNVKNLKISQYNTMFYCPTFYDNIPTETFLVFQTDSIILKENKNKINDFLKYDYVGAPWPKHMGVWGKMEIGNGGLSLRKKSKMVELLKYKNKALETNGNYEKYIAEDQFFNGYYVKEVKVYKPTFIKATEFSVEFVYAEKAFGIHKIWGGGLPYDKLQELIKKYPDIQKLIDLNK
jgi:hypothetical protein